MVTGSKVWRNTVSVAGSSAGVMNNGGVRDGMTVKDTEMMSSAGLENDALPVMKARVSEIAYKYMVFAGLGVHFDTVLDSVVPTLGVVFRRKRSIRGAEIGAFPDDSWNSSLATRKISTSSFLDRRLTLSTEAKFYRNERPLDVQVGCSVQTRRAMSNSEGRERWKGAERIRVALPPMSGDSRPDLKKPVPLWRCNSCMGFLDSELAQGVYFLNVCDQRF
ncbi:hypothetical protein F5146DRAFT_994695 [Armillaria mellea]|nr:hypothetical protein F5146DRAFT_994695 [Armillaria mellea]